MQTAGLVEGPDEDEVREFGPVEAEARAAGRKLKLAALKDCIRQAHRDGQLAHSPAWLCRRKKICSRTSNSTNVMT